MATEAERKFLVRSDAWRGQVEKVIDIQQFYLAVSMDRSVRVRISDGNAAKLTLKFGSHLPVRDEFEYEIALADALEMRGYAVGKVIEKQRHHVRHAGYLYEIDVFAGRLDGLIVAELETADQVPSDMLPLWLGRELTGDMRYSNAMLAQGDVPQPVLQALSA